MPGGGGINFPETKPGFSGSTQAGAASTCTGTAELPPIRRS
jgi:hypothetical protein